MSILGSVLPVGGVQADLYTVPTGRRAVINISACNKGVAPAKIRVALTASAIPADSEFIEFDVGLASSDVIERTAISLAAGQKIVVLTDTGSVAFNAWGIEEVA